MSFPKELPDKNLKEVKTQVLEEQIGYLCEELGDPGRYLPQLRSKGILNSEDCQIIRSKVTFTEKTHALVELLKGRQSTKGEHSLDLLVDALKKQRVQAHIARGLQKALAKATDEATKFDGIKPRPKCPDENVSVTPSSPLPCKDDLGGDGLYEIHPLIGALPPPASPSMHVSSSATQQPDHTVHPQHGITPFKRSSEEGRYVPLEPTGLKEEGFSLSCTGSESELGGQSQPNSVNQTTTTNDSSESSFYHPVSLAITSSTMSNSTPSVLSDSSFGIQEDSIEVVKLEAKVKDLTSQLKDARAKSKMKDLEIEKLHQMLRANKYNYEQETSNIPSLQHPVRPYNLQLNSAGQPLSNNYLSYSYHSSSSSLRKELHEDVASSPYTTGSSYSMRSHSAGDTQTPNGSISFV